MRTAEIRLRLVVLVVALVGAIGSSGCATVGALPKPSAAQGAAVERVLVSTSASLALANNPTYVPVATALVAGIDAVIGGDAILTPESIAVFVRDICRRNNLPPKDTAVFVNLAQSAYTAYVATYRPAVVRSTDPTVLLYVAAFKDGLMDALASNVP